MIPRDLAEPLMANVGVSRRCTNSRIIFLHSRTSAFEYAKQEYYRACLAMFHGFSSFTGSPVINIHPKKPSTTGGTVEATSAPFNCN